MVKKNDVFRLHLDEKSGLAQALQILHTCSTSALQSIHSGERKNFSSSFTTSTFEAASAVHLISGWNFTSESDYLKFAKDETINLKTASAALKIYSFVIHVHPKILQTEKSARKVLIECISGLAMLDRNITEIKDPSQASSLSATARQFLSILKEITSKWLEAKYEVRHMALQYSTSPLADSLMISDGWTSDLFSPSEVKALITSDVTHKGTMSILRMTHKRNEEIKKKQNNKCLCFIKRPYRERSRSPNKREELPFRHKSATVQHNHKGSTQFQNKSKAWPHSKSQQKNVKKYRPLRILTPRKPITQEVPMEPNSNNHDFSRVPVGARLFRFRTVWKGAHETIIKKGLGWTWKKCPPPRKRLKQKISWALDLIVKELRQKRVIEKAKTLRWQSRLFTVPKKDSNKECLILDVSNLNQFINYQSFKMLTLREVKLLLPQKYWKTSIDMMDGYWHIPVTPGKRPYLGFSY